MDSSHNLSLNLKLYFASFFLLAVTASVIYVNSILPYPPARLTNIADIPAIISLEVEAFGYLLISLAICLISLCLLSYLFYHDLRKGLYYGAFLWFTCNLILAFSMIRKYGLILSFKVENYLVIVSILFFVLYTLYVVNRLFCAYEIVKQEGLEGPYSANILFVYLPLLYVYLYLFYSNWATGNNFHMIVEVLVFLGLIFIYYGKNRLEAAKSIKPVKAFFVERALPILSNEYFLILCLAIFAFIPRFYASHIISLEIPNNLGGPDSDNFHSETLSVIGNLPKIFSPIVWPKPGVNIFLVPIYSFFSPDPTIARYFFIAMGVASCLLTYFIGKTVFTKKTGACAAYLHAGYNYLIWNETWIGTEGIAVFLIEVFVLIMIKNQDKPFEDIKSYLLLYLSGLCFGYVILTRPEFMFFPAFFLAWLYFFSNKDLKIPVFVVFMLGVFSILGPWILRNYLAYGKFQLVYNPAYQGDISKEFKSIGIDVTSIPTSALNIFRNFPEFISAIIFSDQMHVNISRFLYWNQYNPYNPSDFIFFRSGTLYYSLAHIFLALFSIMGFVIYLKSYRKKGSLLIVLIVYKILITYVTSYKNWYRVPVEPYLLLLSSLGITTTCSYFLSNDFLKAKGKQPGNFN